MFVYRLQAQRASMAALFAAAASMASTSAGAQPAPAAASAPAAELTPNERAQRDADKFFKWILIHSDKPRKAGVNRTDDKREERPAVAAGVKPAAPIAAAAASPVPVVSASPPAGVALVAETQTAAAPLAAVETRMTATAPAPALPIVLGAPEFDTKRCKWLICIEATFRAATTATAIGR